MTEWANEAGGIWWGQREAADDGRCAAADAAESEDGILDPSSMVRCGDDEGDDDFELSTLVVANQSWSRRCLTLG